MTLHITLAERVSAAVTEDMADAIRRTAAARGISVADYLRGALQGRLLMDGTHIRPLPNLHRPAFPAGRIALR
ncbi:hypothetical protein ASF53_05230 [Methylobacterium sp. Leaf123]|uniref:ribbon-helix-helix protein, CopG family n=1 Tax=Methylobacterium sp. Leaf123 TaxID=1736264 RepID=UPI0006FE3161|nr:ribbon-helix-helix protein, CopG family [Methylobacterium sp. Leaf123]KQQ23727.1 hypothetical protein ASF53_05230 [Methylobacterium sp. Leaf123]